MKRVVFFVCMLLALSVSAQTNEQFDEKLFFRYTLEQLQAIDSTSEDKIDYLNFYVNNAYYFEDASNVPESKRQYYTDIHDLLSVPEGYNFDQMVTEENFNILMYAVQFYNDKTSVYRFGDEPVFVVIRPKEEIYALYNQN